MVTVLVVLVDIAGKVSVALPDKVTSLLVAGRKG